jgi:hypothetical protein
MGHDGLVAIFDWDDDNDWPAKGAEADWRVAMALLIAVSALFALVTVVL